MWGTQKPQGTYPSKRRFISTCCGKNDYFRAVATVLRTPSPRVWRAQGKTQRELAEHRLIPTCVGSTRSSGPQCPSWPAHPHVCGEHWLLPSQDRKSSGSSPRVWGALPLHPNSRQPIRLIPTCVGSTGATDGIAPASAAHPHVCGEHSWRVMRSPLLSGSSPRVWGARRRR